MIHLNRIRYRPRRGVLPTDDVLKVHMESGRTHKEIATDIGCSAYAIQRAFQRLKVIPQKMTARQKIRSRMDGCRNGNGPVC